MCVAVLGGQPIFKSTWVQQAVSGYTSFREVQISTQYNASYNCYNGVTYSDNPSNPSIALSQWITTGYYASDTFRPLMRWENLSSIIPANALVQSAFIQLYVMQWNYVGQCPININYLTKDWSSNPEDVLGQCYRIGWVNSDK